MKMYEWKNKDGDVVEHNHWADPPNLPGEWKRIYSFAAGRVEGGGGSPSRTSIKSDSEPKPTNQVVKLDESNVRWVRDAV
jgi:hypothetical protein